MDYTKDGPENLLALINTANSANYTLDHLAFGTPQANMDPPPSGEDPRNTKVAVIAKPTTALTGMTNVYYDRLELDEVLNTVDFELDNALGEYHSVHDLLPWFLELGYRFTPSDLENDLLAGLTAPYDQVIRAKPESLSFLGIAKIKVTAGP